MLKIRPHWTCFIIALTLLACTRVGIRPETPQAVPPDAPIRRTSLAESIQGTPTEQLYKRAEKTVETVTLDSQLIRRVAADVSPAVVSIYTKTEVPYKLKLLPIPTSGLRFKVYGEALGSAFFIHENGYLLSNNHVVENAKQITARTKEGNDFPVKVVARDPVLDLALLKIENPNQTFPTVPMGDSDAIAEGDWVIAVGNPLGLGHTVTHGIISQIGRQLESELVQAEPGRHVEFLQTDTAINPGSSGGPLITLTGAFVGVNTAVLMGTQGISFAVPSSQVAQFIDSVLKGEGILEP